jgi:hypothetical protein
MADTSQQLYLTRPPAGRRIRTYFFPLAVTLETGLTEMMTACQWRFPGLASLVSPLFVALWKILLLVLDFGGSLGLVRIIQTYRRSSHEI